MVQFDEQCGALFREIGESRKMVLSTSAGDCVTSRMMSIVVFHGKFYFQTDKTFRKYEQLQKNPRAALCFDNFQIEGRCENLGHPSNHSEFCCLYEKNFPGSFKRYTPLTHERLFVLDPAYVKKWIYEVGEPFEEIYDFVHGTYEKRKYVGI